MYKQRQLKPKCLLYGLLFSPFWIRIVHIKLIKRSFQRTLFKVIGDHLFRYAMFYFPFVCNHTAWFNNIIFNNGPLYYFLFNVSNTELLTWCPSAANVFGNWPDCLLGKAFHRMSRYCDAHSARYNDASVFPNSTASCVLEFFKTI